MKIERQPIFVGRKSILTDGLKYVTVASMDANYQGTIEIMSVYPDLETARRYYPEDMNNHRGKGFKAYCISTMMFKDGKRVKIQKEEVPA